MKNFLHPQVILREKNTKKWKMGQNENNCVFRLFMNWNFKVTCILPFSYSTCKILLGILLLLVYTSCKEIVYTVEKITI